LRVTAVVFFVGGLALAGLPPFATTVGKAMVEGALGSAGYWWIVVLVVVSAALTAGTVLRAGTRIFLGWGAPAPEDPSSRQAGEDRIERDHELHAFGRLRLAGPAVALLLAALGLGLVPMLAQRADAAASRFVDRSAYATEILDGRRPPVPAEVHTATPWGDALTGASVAGAVAVAAIAVAGRRRARALERQIPDRLRPVVVMRSTQTGHVGDYVAVAVLGAAVLGTAFAFAAR
jgi:multicomponent Na+:H+ antiporter subunit D